ncbi:MAG: hypothetical protein WBM46_17255 [Polyangiales bacterium]
MRQELEDGREPRRMWCAWIVSLACVAVAGLAPATALAEDEPVPGETAIDDADTAAEAGAFEEEAAPGTEAASGGEVTQATLDEAQAAIEAAERDLETAKRQMELMGRKMAPAPTPVPGTGVGLVSVDGRAKKLQWSLNDDGTLYFRLAMWLQVWTRAIQLNPGTEVLGNSDDWYSDVMIRRARFLAFGEIFPRVFLLMHFGINNQTFRNARKPQLFFHDAWVEFQLSRNDKLYVGGGLLYWNGVSRMTNASTITLMSLDAPIVNWPTIERTDQFARQLGIYAKGKLGLFDYRFAFTRPFTPYDVSLVSGTVPDVAAVGNYNATANNWAYSGYFMFQFLDIESNVLPYTVGTYIGAKKVFNFGLGFHAQPKGIVYLDSTGARAEQALLNTGVDLFLDMPFKTEHGGAATWYGVYYYNDFGPNHIRPIGIENPADPGTGLNGGGNAYTLLGTGHTLYSELGFLIPGTVGRSIQFQPYVNTQISKWEAYSDIMAHFGLGVNMFIEKHNAKVTLEYRNRPIFNADGTVESRKGNSFILQMHLFI